MAASNKVSIKRLRWILIVAGIVCLAIISAWIVYDKMQQSKQADSTTKSTSTNQKSSNTNLTAGGIAVPEVWQAKAQHLGYYCPSWAAKPGEVVSNVCLKLDK